MEISYTLFLLQRIFQKILRFVSPQLRYRNLRQRSIREYDCGLSTLLISVPEIVSNCYNMEQIARFTSCPKLTLPELRVLNALPTTDTFKLLTCLTSRSSRSYSEKCTAFLPIYTYFVLTRPIRSLHIAISDCLCIKETSCIIMW